MGEEDFLWKGGPSLKLQMWCSGNWLNTRGPELVLTLIDYKLKVFWRKKNWAKAKSNMVSLTDILLKYFCIHIKNLSHINPLLQFLENSLPPLVPSWVLIVHAKKRSCLSLTPIGLHQSLQEEFFFSISAAVIQEENENNVELPPELAYAVV